ncbi:MAG: rod shape-determining protein RodA [Gammaproteobacteria bacterium]|nr:rod shape-determining protein RodA [Gammaproteobacteria bacterium]
MTTGVRDRAVVDDRRRPGPDVILFISMIVLAGLGILMVYTASCASLEARGLDPSSLMVKQAIFAVIGLVLFLIGSLIDYRDLAGWSGVIYALILIVLGFVLTTAPHAGANRWILIGPFQFQPSEFAKLGVIIVLAAVLAPAREEGMRWNRLGLALGMLAIPSYLIFRQPDLGTMLVFGFFALVMLFVSGTTFRQLAVLTIGAVGGIVTVWKLQLLRDYQLARLQSFIDPTADPLGIGYNLIRSKIAIGSGGIFGKGLFGGALTNLSFVPAQSTDFIFTAVGEQLGLIGGAIVLFVYAVLLWRLLVIARNARDRFGRLLTVGIAAMLAFQIFVNVGMTIGIMPVTGLPLPLMSAGGSALLVTALALGLANSVWLRRTPVPGEPVNA